MLVGLPDDLCQCPHWGYVLSGRLKLRTKDGEEFFEAGQAFYWSPGHAPMALEDSEYVEFSPTGSSTCSSITSRRSWAELPARRVSITSEPRGSPTGQGSHQSTERRKAGVALPAFEVSAVITFA